MDAVLTASPAVLRTSQEHKRRALRNAVLNAALPTAPEVAIQQTFIGLVDRFTDWHLRILKLIQNPRGWRGADDRCVGPSSSLRAVIAQAFPELAADDKGDFITLVWSDLDAAGLHKSGSLMATMTGEGTMAKRTTDFGDAFLHFIEDPLERSAP